MAVRAFIALGSNVGDRRLFLEQALSMLLEREDLRTVKVSRFWETSPVGGPPGQGMFINAAAEIETDLPPRDFLNVLLEIERALGRKRQKRDGPRSIDLDLLLFGDEQLDEPNLTIPHPRMHERSFVLGPLAEIASTVIHPKLKKPIIELLAALSHQDLLGKRAVVTGSSSGIGKAIAIALAKRGADVMIHARRSKESAEAVAEEVRQQGRQSLVLLEGLHDPTACSRLVNEAWNRFDSIDFWINNAGADTLTGKAGKQPFEAKLQTLLAVDVTATILLSREVGARMKKTGYGVILNMGWDQAETGMEGDSGQLFAASKGAIMAFTRSLALTLAPEVRVNCLAPGWIRTSWGETASQTWQDRAIQESPLKRWGTPEDVANLACWLVSDQAAFITGQTIRVNGGAVR